MTPSVHTEKLLEQLRSDCIRDGAIRQVRGEGVVQFQVVLGVG